MSPEYSVSYLSISSLLDFHAAAGVGGRASVPDGVDHRTSGYRVGGSSLGRVGRATAATERGRRCPGVVAGASRGGGALPPPCGGPARYLGREGSAVCWGRRLAKSRRSRTQPPRLKTSVPAPLLTLATEFASPSLYCVYLRD